MACLRVPVVAVIAAERESDRAFAKAAGLALNACQLTADLGDDVAARVLPEGEEELEAELMEGGHDCEGRPIADVLGVCSMLS
jgi:hypothetical protein